MACDSNTQLMVHLNTGSTTTPDVSQNNNTCTLKNTGAISSTQSKFGGASFTDGVTGYIQIPDAAWMDWGTGDFTIEGWVWITTDADMYMFGRVNGAGNACDILRSQSGGTLRGYIMTNLVINNVWTPNTSQWYAIAFVRSGSTCYMFVDGTQLGATGSNSSSVSETTEYEIGGYGGLFTWSGFIDECRMSNVARYTSNYTPQTQEFCQDITTIIPLLTLLGAG